MKNKVNDIAQANYDRGVLTLDLPRAKQPMLWRQEIKNISNVSFWLARDNGEHTLMLRLANGTEQTIARFDNEAIAEQSLAAIREIFINVKPQRPWWVQAIKIIIWIVVIWVVVTFAGQLITILTIMKPASTSTVTETTPPPTPAPAAQLPAISPPAAPEH